MECIKKIALSEPMVDNVSKRLINSSTYTFLDIDLYKVQVKDLCFSNKYELNIIKDDTVYGIVCWFDAYFSKLKKQVLLSTSPYSRSTHWRQTIFYLNDPIVVKAGKKLTGSIAVRKSATHFRDLDIKISYHYTDAEVPTNYVQMYKLR